MNTNKLLSNLLVGGIFLIPFIPFIVPDTMFFPFITGKNFTFRILIEILLGIWVVLAYRDATYRPKKTPLLIAFAVFVGIMALAGAFGANPSKSFWSNYERMEGVVSLVHFLAYFVITTTVLGARDLWRTFFNVSLGASVLMGFYALFQLWGVFDIHQGSTRVDGTLGNAAYLAVYMLFHIFLALFLMARAKATTILGMLTERLSLFFYIPVILLDTFVLYHTATRGSILGLIGGLLLTAFLIAIFERERLAVRKAALGLLVAIVVLVGGFFAVRDAAWVTGSPVLSRFSSISLTEQTTKSRFMVWNMAYQGFKEHPILGWGQESFSYVFNKYYDPKMYAQEPWFDRAHNVFFDWLIAGGILGLLAYLSLFGVALWYLWRKGSIFSVLEKSVITGLFAGYFFQNLFVFDNLASYLLFFAVLAFLESSARDAAPEGGKEVKKKKEAQKAVTSMDLAIVPLAVIGTITALYFVNARPLAANYALIDALKPEQGGPMVNLEDFKKTIGYDSFGTSEAREQLSQITLQAIATPQVDGAIKQAFVDLAASELKKQADLLPNDARYQLFFGSFLGHTGHYDEALVYLNKAHELSPNKQAILFELGNVYYNMNNRTKAEEVFKRAYELAPEYGDAENFYLRILTEAKQYDAIKKLLTDHITRTPGDADPHVKLSALYFEMGRPIDAITEIEVAITLNPAFKAQGEAYIQNIKAGKRL